MYLVYFFLLFELGMDVYKADRSCHIATPNQSMHIDEGNDDQPPVFHIDTGTAY